MLKKIVFLAMLPLFVLVLAGCGGQGQKPDQNATQDGNKGSAPADMASACANKSEGDSCEITLPGKSEKTSGTCKKGPKGDQLACMSQNGQGGPGGQGQKPNDSKK